MGLTLLPLVTVLFIGLLRRGRPVLAAILFGAALSLRPPLLFAFPLVCAHLIGAACFTSSQDPSTPAAAGSPSSAHPVRPTFRLFRFLLVLAALLFAPALSALAVVRRSQGGAYLASLPSEPLPSEPLPSEPLLSDVAESSGTHSVDPAALTHEFPSSAFRPALEAALKSFTAELWPPEPFVRVNASDALPRADGSLWSVYDLAAPQLGLPPLDRAKALPTLFGLACAVLMMLMPLYRAIVAPQPARLLAAAVLQVQ